MSWMPTRMCVQAEALRAWLHAWCILLHYKEFSYQITLHTIAYILLVYTSFLPSYAWRLLLAGSSEDSSAARPAWPSSTSTIWYTVLLHVNLGGLVAQSSTIFDWNSGTLTKSIKNKNACFVAVWLHFLNTVSFFTAQMGAAVVQQSLTVLRVGCPTFWIYV